MARYFTVEKEVISGVRSLYRVNSDGSSTGETFDDKGDAVITTGFWVNEYGEDGTELEARFFPVKTNTALQVNNEAEVLARIKDQYPAEIYQNHDW